MLYIPNVLKYCSSCGQYKLATIEHFARSKRTPDKLHGSCRVCHGIRTKRWKDKNRQSNSEINREWHERNKQRRNEVAKQRRHDDPIRARQSVLNAIAKRPDYYRDLSRNWHKKNPLQHRANQHKRRLRKEAAGTKHTKQDILNLDACQQGRCYYCGVAVGDTYHVDHVIPLSRGGSNGPENIVIACPHCNRSKGNKLLSEWRP